MRPFKRLKVRCGVIGHMDTFRRLGRLLAVSMALILPLCVLSAWPKAGWISCQGGGVSHWSLQESPRQGRPQDPARGRRGHRGLQRIFQRMRCRFTIQRSLCLARLTEPLLHGARVYVHPLSDFVFRETLLLQCKCGRGAAYGFG